MKKLTESQHNKGFNQCDKCNIIINSHELIWITAEGFQPLKDEFLKESTYKQYDALCTPCYLSELI